MTIAAMMGRTECIKLLIGAGIDVNSTGTDGISVLYYARQSAGDEALLLLEAAGGVNKHENDKGFLNNLHFYKMQVQSKQMRCCRLKKMRMSVPYKR